MCIRDRYNVTASNKLLRCLKYNELNEGDKWTPEYKAGQVLFFPGTMLHGVTPHKSDVVRETLSCNFDIVCYLLNTILLVVDL